MMQTIAGLVLDSPKWTSAERIQKVLNAFVTLNIIQFVGVYSMMVFDHSRRRRLLSVMVEEPEEEPLTANSEHEETLGEMHTLISSQRAGSMAMSRRRKEVELVIQPAERMRGKFCFALSAMMILWTWMLFIICTILEFPVIRS